MAVANPTAAGESNEVDLSDKLATREVASIKNTSHLARPCGPAAPKAKTLSKSSNVCSPGVATGRDQAKSVVTDARGRRRTNTTDVKIRPRHPPDADPPGHFPAPRRARSALNN